MKLYHGSIFQVKHPIVAKGRNSTDFGKGFYTTTNFQQAQKWALRRQTAVGAETKAIVTTYEAADDLLRKNEYNIKSFESPNKEWLSFVVSCRKSLLHEYDIVFGAVANDNIYLTITMFESGLLTAEETVQRLKVNEIFDQISFHSDKAIKELIFVESLVV